MSAIDQDFVRDLIERHSDASGGNGRDFHNGAYVAISDELNATLGSRNCSNNCTNSERTRACLPHFWTHDGVLHIELPKLPESISVRLPDQRDREVHSARVWQYTRGDADLAAENAKLRELLAKARDPRRIGGTADPESFVYAIEQLREFRWQHATNDEEAIPYINNVADAHERENAKLRELVRILAYCMSEDRDCDRCALNGADMPTPRISACDSLPDLMRELGVEVTA